MQDQRMILCDGLFAHSLLVQLVILLLCAVCSDSICVSHSSGLDPRQCLAWQEFWDGSGGEAWRPIKNCTTRTTNNRDDPCICKNNVVCEGTDITKIILPAQGLANVLADSLQSLTSLRHLELQDNHELGGEFPDFLSHLTSLTYLDLSNCKLRDRVPEWNYSRYTYCSIGGLGNRYCTPVPAEVAGCNQTAITTGLLPCRPRASV